jgi:hypothetical protein
MTPGIVMSRLCPVIHMMCTSLVEISLVPEEGLQRCNVA